MLASGLSPFSYAILRIVPNAERGECFNVGVILFCRQLGFLQARVALDEARLGLLGPDALAHEVQAHLDALVRVANGASDAGPIAALPRPERFGWLTAPSSTIAQVSEVHTGLCRDPAATLDGLFARLVSSP